MKEEKVKPYTKIIIETETERVEIRKDKSFVNFGDLMSELIVPAVVSLGFSEKLFENYYGEE